MIKPSTVLLLELNTYMKYTKQQKEKMMAKVIIRIPIIEIEVIEGKMVKLVNKKIKEMD